MRRKNASVLWFDPGTTTGVCYVEIAPKWLEGTGKLTWSAMGNALEYFQHEQVGRHARIVDEKTRKSIRPEQTREEIGGVDGKPATGGKLTSIVEGEIKQVWQLQDWLDEFPVAAWGYEDFQLRAFNSSPEFLSPLRIFSMLTLSNLTGDNRVPFVQSPSTAKSTATDERLQAAGLYRPGMIHATDAARHAATFLWRARGSEELRKAAWPSLFN